MVENICDYLTKKIRSKMPEVDDGRAEIINYGLQLIIGEIPKMFLAIGLALVLSSVKLGLITLLFLIPYRGFTGGFHLKTHIGCFICTTIMYSLPGIVSRYFPITGNYEYIAVVLVLIFAIWMITLYAPADTINLPILTKKERKLKRNLSYVILAISMASAIITKDSKISSVIIYTIFMQTLFITKTAYRISNCEYGYMNLNKDSLNY